ncbi:MAG: hypothetical protein Q9190_004424 [Brigantiaea leucoxantha]
MSPPKTVRLAVIGIGGVGSAFLSQLSSLNNRLPDLSLSLIFLARSTKTLTIPSAAHTLSLSTCLQDLSASTSPSLSPSQLLSYLLSFPSPCVLVDNTSNQDLANHYPHILKNGISIVTPNKKAFSDDISLFQQLVSSSFPADLHGGLLYHESTVGAGLPIISTLKDLVDTGDTITRIEGVFSGTMSFLFNTFAPCPPKGNGKKWSEIVLEAKNAGFTEPDPRDDLNGLDVARKLVILARLAGLQVKDTRSFPVQSLIPAALEDAKSGEEFMTRLPNHDGEMEQVRRDAENEGKVVRFVGSIDVAAQEVKVGLEKFDVGHPIAGLKGSGNFISFYTRRYGSDPLIVQGAGAGGEITAMGVMADLIKVLQRIS